MISYICAYRSLFLQILIKVYSYSIKKNSSDIKIYNEYTGQ